MKNKFQNVKITKLPKSEVEIEAEIVAESLALARETAIKQTKETLEIPGFRVGHVPTDVVIKQVGEMNLLERAAGIVLDAEYGNILSEHNIKAIGMPKITITKLALGNPLGFKIITTVLPEFSFDKYSEIAKKELHGSGAKNSSEKPSEKTEEFSTSDDEVNLVIEDLKKREGEKFKDSEDLRGKIKENITEQKKIQAKDKKRLALAEKMIAAAAIELPDLLVEHELDVMLNQFKGDIEKAGLTYEGYLKQINKKEEEIKKDWRKNAENKASLQLILNHIAAKENIKPDENRVKQEMEHILKHYKDADRFRVRMYVENLLLNEAVFQFLEGVK